MLVEAKEPQTQSVRSVEKVRAGRFGGNLPASDCALGERSRRQLTEVRPQFYSVFTLFVPHLSHFFKVHCKHTVLNIRAKKIWHDENGQHLEDKDVC